MRIASQLCTAVFEGDLPLLRRLLRAGAPPDKSNYNKCTVLNVAAAEGNLPTVRIPTYLQSSGQLLIYFTLSPALCPAHLQMTNDQPGT